MSAWEWRKSAGGWRNTRGQSQIVLGSLEENSGVISRRKIGLLANCLQRAGNWNKYTIDQSMWSISDLSNKLCRSVGAETSCTETVMSLLGMRRKRRMLAKRLHPNHNHITKYWLRTRLNSAQYFCPRSSWIRCHWDRLRKWRWSRLIPAENV
jgi:hypothetical protein